MAFISAQGVLHGLHLCAMLCAHAAVVSAWSPLHGTADDWRVLTIGICCRNLSNSGKNCEAIVCSRESTPGSAHLEAIDTARELCCSLRVLRDHFHEGTCSSDRRCRSNAKLSVPLMRGARGQAQSGTPTGRCAEGSSSCPTACWDL